MIKENYSVLGPDKMYHNTIDYADALALVLDASGSKTFEGWGIKTGSPSSMFVHPDGRQWQITTLN